LFEGYEDYFMSLVPTSTYSSLDLQSGSCPTKIPAENPFPTVLSHNDIHQNNILMRLTDNRDLLLIDNEYAGWNPMAMDLAVYINEVMIDNSHPGENGVKEYIDNAMSAQEQERLIKSYMKNYFETYMPEEHKAEFGHDHEAYASAHFDNLQI
jgi:thiamine kinase-like enzyme